MREVSTSEAVATLPALLEEAKTHELVIQADGQRLGALVSMNDLRIIRRARMEEAERLGDIAYETIKRNAETLGERIDDVEKVFRRD